MLFIEEIQTSSSCHFLFREEAHATGIMAKTEVVRLVVSRRGFPCSHSERLAVSGYSFWTIPYQVFISGYKSYPVL